MTIAQMIRMALLHAQIKLEMTMDKTYPKDPNSKNWRTMNGQHVHLKNGKIDGGAGGKFNGKSWSGKQPHEYTKGKTSKPSGIVRTGLRSENGDKLTEKQRLSILTKETGIKGDKAKKMLDVLDDWTTEGAEIAFAQKLQSKGKKYGNKFFDEGATLVEEYISKAPKFSEPMFRGIVIPKTEKAQFLKDLKKGAIKVNKSGSTQSWSAKEDVATMYAEEIYSDDDLKVVFCSKNGHPQSTSITHFKGDAYGLGEVIVSKDAQWIVKNSVMKDGIVRIDVEPKSSKKTHDANYTETEYERDPAKARAMEKRKAELYTQWKGMGLVE